jgi:hypothetical protein
MFGVGPQEMVIIGLIFLVSEARRAIDDFKEEITAAGDDEEDDK